MMMMMMISGFLFDDSTSYWAIDPAVVREKI